MSVLCDLGLDNSYDRTKRRRPRRVVSATIADHDHVYPADRNLQITVLIDELSLWAAIAIEIMVTTAVIRDERRRQPIILNRAI